MRHTDDSDGALSVLRIGRQSLLVVSGAPGGRHAVLLDRTLQRLAEARCGVTVELGGITTVAVPVLEALVRGRRRHAESGLTFRIAPSAAIPEHCLRLLGLVGLSPIGVAPER
jgi:hypothetical protein